MGEWMQFSPDDVLLWVQSLTAEPMMLALALALATLITEDGALITGSLLVGGGMVSPWLAIGALAFGIAAGDMGLYALGWTARESRFLRARLPIRRAIRLKKWLEPRQTPVLFLSRFLPGTRLPTYLTFGFFRLPPLHFALVMSVAAMVWCSLMVLFVSEIQRLVTPIGGLAGVGAGLVVALLMIMAAQRLVGRTRHARALAAAGVADKGGPIDAP